MSFHSSKQATSPQIQQDHDRFKNIKLKVLKAAPGNVYEEHKRFILAFQPEWRQDHNIIFLLSAITLFTPERPNIIHGDAIKHERVGCLGVSLILVWLSLDVVHIIMLLFIVHDIVLLT